MDPIKTEVDVKRSEKKDFVSNLKEDFLNATSVIVAEYSGLTVIETEQLRKEMRDNGAKFKVTKNRLTKLAISLKLNLKIFQSFLKVQQQLLILMMQ